MYVTVERILTLYISSFLGSKSKERFADFLALLILFIILSDTSLILSPAFSEILTEVFSGSLISNFSDNSTGGVKTLGLFGGSWFPTDSVGGEASHWTTEFKFVPSDEFSGLEKFGFQEGFIAISCNPLYKETVSVISIWKMTMSDLQRYPWKLDLI